MMRNPVTVVLYFVFFIAVEIFVAGHMNAAQTGDKDEIKSWENNGIDEIHAIRNVLSGWEKAWNNKNLSDYLSYYSPNFRTGDMDYQALKLKRIRQFKKSNSISVQISNLWISVEGKIANARFMLKYEDTSRSNIGEKYIRLAKSNGSWKIISEEWKPLTP